MIFGPTAPYNPPTERPGGTSLGGRYLVGRGTDVWTEAHRASLWPLGRLILLAFLAGVIVGASITFALSAAASTASHRVTTGQVLDTAAVRADSLVEPHTATRVAPIARDQLDGPNAMAATTSEDLPPASSGTAPTPAAILAIIRNAAHEFGQDAEAMIAVARCESSLRPDVLGDGGAAAGLWQFHLPTWTANARRLFGRDVGDLRMDPVKSSLVAAYMWSQHQQWQWTCAR